MAGRGPAIHVVLVCVSQKTRVAGPRPAMTVGETYGSSSMRFGMSSSIVGFELHSAGTVLQRLLSRTGRRADRCSLRLCRVGAMTIRSEPPAEPINAALRQPTCADFRPVQPVLRIRQAALVAIRPGQKVVPYSPVWRPPTGLPGDGRSGPAFDAVLQRRSRSRSDKPASVHENDSCRGYRQVHRPQ